MKKLGLALIVLMMVMVAAGCGSSDGNKDSEASKEPLKITMPTWTGYGPLFLAKEKGLFKKHGVDVELSIVEGLGERKQALAGGKIDGMATALDVQSTLSGAGLPVEVVWVLDDSNGGDGIIVKNDIKTAKDLKGKKVAYEVGSTSHLLLLTALKDAGLTDKDIEAIPMSAGDAGAAFAAGKVDAAVTWEPWLTKSSQANGKILLSTKELPGIIVDTVSFSKETIEKRPKDVEAFVAAMADAMEEWKNDKQGSEEIMAKGLHIELKEFTGTVTGLKFFDGNDNKQLFGTKDNKGDLYSSAKNAIDFYEEQKVFDTTPSVDELINPEFVGKLK